MRTTCVVVEALGSEAAMRGLLDAGVVGFPMLSAESQLGNVARGRVMLLEIATAERPPPTPSGARAVGSALRVEGALGEPVRVDRRRRQSGRIPEPRLREVEELEHRVGVGVACRERREVEAGLDEAQDGGMVGGVVGGVLAA